MNPSVSCLRKRGYACGFYVILIGLLAAGSRRAWGQSEMMITADLLQGLQWRSIGPAVFGGRLDEVVGVPGNPNIIYIAHSSAGLFKSTNGGTTFKSIFDNAGTLSIGALALSPENPQVIYVGTGEGNPRNSASFGDGIYKSLDGGRTWKHLGLEKTERIARIAVDPRNPQIVLAAAMGHEWGPNEERGIYRSADGGASWERVLYVNETTGASDVQFDPKNPNIVYAGMFDYLRKPWRFRSGGPGSGLYRSSDRGVTWVKLTDSKLKNGLPSGGLGRVGVAVSSSNAEVVYAIVPAKEGMLWRSADGGQSWTMVNANTEINSRPFYFSQVRVDPLDENRVYSLAGELLVSVDGGKTFKQIAERIHGDHHALWIDPQNPNRLLNGSDGGFHISNDRGATWDFVNTLPLAQAYHVSVDMAEPYNVLSGFQDNEVWRGPSEKRNREGVKNGDWQRLVGWGDGQNAIADPRDPNIIYLDTHTGDITRIDLRTGEARFITPHPVLEFGTGVGAFRYRFNWNTPIYMSLHNPDVIYLGGNVLFKTSDAGNTWTAVSPDLTSNDPEKLTSSGGPLTQDNTNAEAYCTITAISEDAVNPGVLWVGTDDGHVQITRDGGRTWTNVVGNIRGLPPESWVSSLHASPHDPGRAYVAFDRHQWDDFAPYVYATSDYGKTWSKISDGLCGYVHVVREDPRQHDLLYAGTELGIFTSFDRGKSWTDLRLGLPPLPAYDLTVHPRENDLIMATHARGMYILDDVTALQQLAQARSEPLALFKPMPATRFEPVPGAGSLGDRVFVAKNRPYRALISYYLAKAVPGEKTEEKVELQVLDSHGKVIRTLEGTNSDGINRVVWDLREDPPGGAKTVQESRETYISYSPQLRGPEVLPGNYTVNLIARGHKVAQTFSVRFDARQKASQEDLMAQQQAIRHLLEMQERAEIALQQINALTEQLKPLRKRLSDQKLVEVAGTLQKELEAIVDELRASPGEYRGPAKLIEQIAYLRHLVASHSGPPPMAQREWIDNYEKQLSAVLEHLDKVLKQDVAEFNGHLRAAGVPYLAVTQKK